MTGAIIGTAVLLLVIGLGIASFFVRRHGEVASPAASWTSTDEVFNDPSTNRVMRVWLDASGERHYVPEGERPAT